MKVQGGALEDGSIRSLMKGNVLVLTVVLVKELEKAEV